MASLTAEEITNLYLYGSKNKPDDLLSENLLRASPQTVTTSVDVNEYING